MPALSTAANIQTASFRSSPNIHDRKNPSSYQSSGFPASYHLFSSSFKEPEPPLVPSEFSCNFKQHKWNPNVSHIASGTIYFSSSNQKVRADAAYTASLQSSLFDYTNVSSDGRVSNKVYTFTPNVATKPALFSDYVVPGFPLWEADTLVKSSAVYGGLVDDRDMGTVTSVRICCSPRLELLSLISPPTASMITTLETCSEGRKKL